MRAFLGSVVAVAAATGLVLALRPITPTLSLGVVYTPAVLAVAVFFGMGWAIAGAVASMLTFNYFFLAPVHTFSLTDARNWTALSVYVVTAVVASELAARSRRRAAEAAQREREAALLSDVAAELLQAHEDGRLIADVEARREHVLAGSDSVARQRFDAALQALLAVAAERDQLEEDARDAETLRRSDTIKTTILQSISHDFRTPLATMSAAVGGLASGELELSAADRAELIETVELELARLTRLVENLLDLSRLQAGAAEPHRELWSVGDLAAGAAGEATDPARVSVAAAADLPAVRVDAVQLQRSLVNLVDNALKFSTGPVEVVASLDDDRVVVDVLDRGPGIAGDGAALMRPFERGTDSGGGVGLGLAIALGFAAVNDAELTLGQRPGGGACARLRLPAETVPAEVTA